MKVLYLLSVFCIAAVAAQKKDCHLRNLNACMAPLLIQARNPETAFPQDDKEVDRQCSEMHEIFECVSNYTTDCAPPFMRDIFNFLSGHGHERVQQQYCTAGGAIRVEYLKYAKCLREAAASPEARECLNDVFATLDVMDDETTNLFEMGCCTSARYRKCWENIVESKCGQEAIQAALNQVEQTPVRGMLQMCECFEQRGEECQQILPPPGTPPKGKDSPNAIAKFIAQIMNVN